MFLQFYGLNEQPFGVTPDPRFLYMGPAQQEAFSSLVYGIETGRGFMALIASPGLGKTTILLRLMERLRESARTAFLFQTHTNSEEFLRSLLADLDIEPSGQDLGDLQRQLGDVLIQEAKSGRRIVVAIDEAQNLDDRDLGNGQDALKFRDSPGQAPSDCVGGAAATCGQAGFPAFGATPPASIHHYPLPPSRWRRYTQIHRSPAASRWIYGEWAVHAGGLGADWDLQSRNSEEHQ